MDGENETQEGAVEETKEETTGETSEEAPQALGISVGEEVKHKDGLA